ncbi:ankyrin repeat domain-containing protein [Rhizobium binxianense]
MTIIWDGLVGADLLDEAQLAVRHGLADACKDGDWDKAFAILRKHPTLVNATRPGGTSLYAPLHQAAYIGATLEVVCELLDLGAWRTLPNAHGDRPLDLAGRCGREDLSLSLTPAIERHVPTDILEKMQTHFHGVIRERVMGMAIRLDGLRLPEIAPLLEVPNDREPFWFAVPGMHGGFEYRLRADGAEAVLVSRSWSRVVEGSGRRHDITSEGATLVEQGFV